MFKKDAVAVDVSKKKKRKKYMENISFISGFLLDWTLDVMLKKNIIIFCLTSIKALTLVTLSFHSLHTWKLEEKIVKWEWNLFYTKEIHTITNCNKIIICKQIMKIILIRRRLNKRCLQQINIQFDNFLLVQFSYYYILFSADEIDS